MSRKASFSLSSIFFLQLCLGLFFLMLGLMGMDSYNSRLSEFARFLGRDDAMRKLMAVVELVMGAVLVVGLFLPVPAGIAKVFAIALFALWAIYMLLNFVLNDSFMEPSTIVWLYNVSWNGVILVSLWVVGRKYM